MKLTVITLQFTLTTKTGLSKIKLHQENQQEYIVWDNNINSYFGIATKCKDLLKPYNKELSKVKQTEPKHKIVLRFTKTMGWNLNHVQQI